MNDRSGTITSKNQAVVIALAVLLAVSLSAVAALVVNRVNSQQTGADIPTPAATYTPALSPAAEEVVPTSTDNQTAEAATEAQTEEAPAAIGAPAEVAPAEVAPVEVALLKRPLLKRPLLKRTPQLRDPTLTSISTLTLSCLVLRVSFASNQVLVCLISILISTLSCLVLTV